MVGLVYAPDTLAIHLSILSTSMMVHGYNAEQLLLGTITSLPKDLRGDICDSNNYRGICLSSSINKMLEWIMLHRYGDQLKTSGLQFSFNITTPHPCAV